MCVLITNPLSKYRGPKGTLGNNAGKPASECRLGSVQDFLDAAAAHETAAKLPRQDVLDYVRAQKASGQFDANPHKKCLTAFMNMLRTPSRKLSKEVSLNPSTGTAFSI